LQAAFRQRQLTVSETKQQPGPAQR
jgi:hypothetical protein